MTSLFTATSIANWMWQHGVPVHGAVSLHPAPLSTVRVIACATPGISATLAIHAATHASRLIDPRPVGPTIPHLTHAASATVSPARPRFLDVLDS
jgi:hypothetical protein